MKKYLLILICASLFSCKKNESLPDDSEKTKALTSVDQSSSSLFSDEWQLYVNLTETSLHNGEIVASFDVVPIPGADMLGLTIKLEISGKSPVIVGVGSYSFKIPTPTTPRTTTTTTVNATLYRNNVALASNSNTIILNWNMGVTETQKDIKFSVPKLTQNPLGITSLQIDKIYNGTDNVKMYVYYISPYTSPPQGYMKSMLIGRYEMSSVNSTTWGYNSLYLSNVLNGIPNVTLSQIRVFFTNKDYDISYFTSIIPTLGSSRLIDMCMTYGATIDPAAPGVNESYLDVNPEYITTRINFLNRIIDAQIEYFY